MLPLFVVWMGLGCCQGIIVDDRAASDHGRILMPLAPHGWHPCRYDDFSTQWDFLSGVHPLWFSIGWFSYNFFLLLVHAPLQCLNLFESNLFWFIKGQTQFSTSRHVKMSLTLDGVKQNVLHANLTLPPRMHCKLVCKTTNFYGTFSWVVFSVGQLYRLCSDFKGCHQIQNLPWVWTCVQFWKDCVLRSDSLVIRGIIFRLLAQIKHRWL